MQSTSFSVLLLAYEFLRSSSKVEKKKKKKHLIGNSQEWPKLQMSNLWMCRGYCITARGYRSTVFYWTVRYAPDRSTHTCELRYDNMPVISLEFKYYYTTADRMNHAPPGLRLPHTSKESDVTSKESDVTSMWRCVSCDSPPPLRTAGWHNVTT